MHAAMVITIYSVPAIELAQNILYIVATKKIQAFSEEELEELETQKTFLNDVIGVRLAAAINEVQTEITDAGEEVKHTVLTIPHVTIESVTAVIEVSLAQVAALTLDLQHLLANLHSMELAVTAITTALDSTSTTGEKAEEVIELTAAIEALSLSL